MLKYVILNNLRHHHLFFSNILTFIFLFLIIFVMKDFNVLSWNIMGQGITISTYDKILKKLNDLRVDILCLQELFPSRKRVEQIQKLGNYHMVREKNLITIDKIYDACFIFSKYPIIDSGEIEFKDPAAVRKIKKIVDTNRCTWTDIKFNGDKVRIYNCHLKLIQTGIAERLKFMNLILNHAKKASGPVIICGDMNTVIPAVGLARKIIQKFHNIPDQDQYINGEYYQKDERYIFEKLVESLTFKNITDTKQTTWAFPHTSFEIFKLKLDWFFIKNIQHKSIQFLPYTSSDHRPILVNFSA